MKSTFRSGRFPCSPFRCLPLGIAKICNLPTPDRYFVVERLSLFSLSLSLSLSLFLSFPRNVSFPACFQQRQRRWKVGGEICFIHTHAVKEKKKKKTKKLRDIDFSKRNIALGLSHCFAIQMTRYFYRGWKIKQETKVEDYRYDVQLTF